MTERCGGADSEGRYGCGVEHAVEDVTWVTCPDGVVRPMCEACWPWRHRPHPWEPAASKKTNGVGQG